MIIRYIHLKTVFKFDQTSLIKKNLISKVSYDTKVEQAALLNGFIFEILIKQTYQKSLR